jgi:hypothetical protein
VAAAATAGAVLSVAALPAVFLYFEQEGCPGCIHKEVNQKKGS